MGAINGDRGLGSLYIGPDPEWAHGTLAEALGEPVEVVGRQDDSLFHGPDSYDLVFLDLTGAVDQSWQRTISRLWQQDLRVVVISPKPNWEEARWAMRSGAVGYAEKTTVVLELAEEIAKAKDTPAHHPR